MQRFLKISFYYFTLYFNRLRYFIFPNFLGKRKYSFKTYPSFENKPFFIGKGSIKIGENCGFGCEVTNFVGIYNTSLFLKKKS